jgi:flagellar biosynthesis protein FlhF
MDLVSIIQNYEQFAPSSVIVTKWDETRAYGNVLSVLSEKGKAISYITDGQKVPKEIERATVSRFLLNLNDFNIDRMHIEDAFPEEK